ncbi:MAG: hypothetical protein JXQ72_00420 [Anaerolineae bacterium]|nr:hypothetical protein [Anaerolineae bacterium]
MIIMSSWKLLRALTSFWTLIDDPVFARETAHPPVWYAVVARLSHATGLMLAVGGLGCYLTVLITFYFNSFLVILLPFLVLWIVLVASTLGAVVVQERERRTWETLRTVPLDVERLILGKAGGALWWLRDLIRVMGGILMLVAIGIGLVSLVLIPNTAESQVDWLPSTLLCGIVLVLPLVSAAVYIADRAQQFVLMAMASLAISAQSSSVRVAMSWAVVAAFCVWLVDIGMAIIVLAVLPREDVFVRDTNLIALALLGPVVSYLSALSLPLASLTIGGTLAVREGLIRLVWRLTVRAAREV